MEFTESGSTDDTLNSKNSETDVEDTKYEHSEVLPGQIQIEDDQSGEQVYGYLYRSSEDATIYVDPRGFMQGQSLIVTQNDDGNEIIVLVSEDPEGQPLDPTFAHTVLQPDEVNFDDGLKEQGTLVMDERSQGLEFMQPEEVSEEHEERHMYVENSGEILNISNENIGSPVEINSPLWSVSNSGRLKNDGTEMLFIPNPTVLVAPHEETKHRKLMQLACIAHELQSADQRNSSTMISDCNKDHATSAIAYENPLRVTQNDQKKNSVAERIDSKSSSSNEREEFINVNSKSSKVSTVLPRSSVRAVDNTVSVIHSTSSEIQSTSLENQTKLSSLPVFTPEKNFTNSESLLSSAMIYSNISNLTICDSLDGSSNTKQLEACSIPEKENSQSSLPEQNDQSLMLEENNHSLKPEKNNESLIPEENSQSSVSKKNSLSLVTEENSNFLMPAENSQFLIPEEDNRKSLVPQLKDSRLLICEEENNQSLVSERGKSQFLIPEEENSPYLVPQEDNNQSLVAEEKNSQFLVPEEKSSQSLVLEKKNSQSVSEEANQELFVSEDENHQSLIPLEKNTSSLVIEKENDQILVCGEEKKQPIVSEVFEMENSPYSVTEEENHQFLVPKEKNKQFVVSKEENYQSFLIPEENSSPSSVPKENNNPSLLPEEKNYNFWIPDKKKHRFLIPEKENSRSFISEEKKTPSLVSEEKDHQILPLEGKIHRFLVSEKNYRSFIPEEKNNSSLVPEEENNQSSVPEEENHQFLVHEEINCPSSILQKENKFSVTEQIGRSSATVENNGQYLVPEVISERCFAQNDNLELNKNDSPLISIHKTPNLNISNLNSEDNVLNDTEPGTKISDNNSAALSVLIIEDEDQKSHKSDSSASLRDCDLSEEVNMKKRMPQDDNISIKTASENIISNTKHFVSVSDKESLSFSRQCSIFNYNQNATKSALEKSHISSYAFQDNNSQTDNSQIDFNESNRKKFKADETKFVKIVNTTDLEHSPVENLDCDLVIAEAVEDSESISNDAEKISSDDTISRLRKDMQYQTPIDIRRNNTTKLVSTANLNSDNKLSTALDNESFHQKISDDDLSAQEKFKLDAQFSPSRKNKECSEVSPVKKSMMETCFESQREEEDHSSSEETIETSQRKKTEIVLFSDDNNEYVNDIGTTSYIEESHKKNASLQASTETCLESLRKEEENYSSSEETISRQTEETSQRKKTEIVLFSDDNNEYVNDVGTTSYIEESHRKGASLQVSDSITDDDDVTFESKVYAPKNYVNSVPKTKSFCRKKKHSIRSQRLRSRNYDLKDNLYDLKDSDYLPWGNVLMETSFKPCNLPNEAPSTSFASESPKEASIHVTNPEQHHRKINKYKRDFDRLLNSSPIATKQQKISKISSQTHPNIIRATKSRYFRSPRFSKSSSLLRRHSNLSESHPREKVHMGFNNKGYENYKKDKVHYSSANQYSATKQLKESYTSNRETYTCTTCNFISTYVDNLIEHLKYCSRDQPFLDYEVFNMDMDKRQRIRGEEEIINTVVNNSLKKIRNDIRSALLEEVPTISFFVDDPEMEDIDERRNWCRRYGYAPDDVVWTKYNKRYWPCLVYRIDDVYAYLRLINYPQKVKGFKVINENVLTFNNSKWNLRCLMEAEDLPYKEIFVKAVQSCERYMSKKFLGITVSGKEYFSMEEEGDDEDDDDEFPLLEEEGTMKELFVKEDLADCETGSTCSESSSSLKPSPIDVALSRMDPARAERYQKLNLQNIYNYIMSGKADDFVLDIYHEKISSEKHKSFFDDDKSTFLSKPLFGPFDEMLQVPRKFLRFWLKAVGSSMKSKSKAKIKRKRNQLFRHFRDLFFEKIGEEAFYVSYVTMVMIPEAIIKAISVVNDIPLREAEIYIDSEGEPELESEEEDDDIEKNEDELEDEEQKVFEDDYEDEEDDEYEDEVEDKEGEENKGKDDDPMYIPRIEELLKLYPSAYQ